ncbi:hypothetical protein [Microcoleus sp. Z1_C3]|uniref:hypothetical protein n=1 Tax=unclassified Microcoleus TaxID=2642155 RepID=UPI002FD30542
MDYSKPVQLSIIDVNLYERLVDNTPPQKGKRRMTGNPDGKQLSIWDVKEAIS